MVKQLFWDGVLAGHYRGKDLSDRTLLAHAVAEFDFKVGRLNMKRGDVLCRSVKPNAMATAGITSWEHVKKCPKCLERIVLHELTVEG